jgi:carbon storage regulator
LICIGNRRAAWESREAQPACPHESSEESIVIGGNIVVTILGVEGEKIKLGFEAPREITILRKELIDVLQQRNRLAEELSSMAGPPAFQGLRGLLAEESGQPEPPPD